MPLPAPYAPPWKRLGEDGVALLAWLGLKARELWRRNGDGTLPMPSFWPRRWQRLFWPLVLALMVVIVLALGRAWWAGAVRNGRGPEPPTAQPNLPFAEGAAGPPLNRSTEGEGDVSLATPPGGGTSRPPRATSSRSEQRRGKASTLKRNTAEASDKPPARPLAEATGEPPRGSLAQSTGEPSASPGAEATGEPSAGPRAEATGEPPWGSLAQSTGEPSAGPRAEATAQASGGPATAPADGGAEEAKPQTEAERLRVLWNAEDRDAPITDFSPQPATDTLSLQLNASFLALPPTQRQRQAERWRQRASEQGYSHLHLLDGEGRLVGRDALVGGGMILLEPAAAARLGD